MIFHHFIGGKLMRVVFSWRQRWIVTVNSFWLIWICVYIIKGKKVIIR